MNITCIVHPFFSGLIPGKSEEYFQKNFAYYSKIIDKSLNDPEGAIIYLYTPYSNEYEEVRCQEEIALESILIQAKQKTPDRVALFLEGVQDTSGLFIPSEGGHVLWDPYSMNPLEWFCNNRFNVYYDENLSSVFLDCTSMSNRIRDWYISEEHWNKPENGKVLYAGTRILRQEPLSPAFEAIIRNIGVEESNIPGLVEIPRHKRESVSIFGTGEFIDACVYANTTDIAITLGVPLQNIRVDIEHPLFVREGREGLGFDVFEKPYPALINNRRDNENNIFSGRKEGY